MNKHTYKQGSNNNHNNNNDNNNDNNNIYTIPASQCMILDLSGASRSQAVQAVHKIHDQMS